MASENKRSGTLLALWAGLTAMQVATTMYSVAMAKYAWLPFDLGFLVFDVFMVYNEYQKEH